MKHILVGNPENRRIDLFQRALLRLGYAPAVIVSYHELLRNPDLLHESLNTLTRDSALNRDSNDATQRIFVRLESPGENFPVERLLIAKGFDCIPNEFQGETVSAHAAKRLRWDHGRLRYPMQHFLGYSHLLTEIETTVSNFPGVSLYNTPSAILDACDKRRCHEVLSNAKVTVPYCIHKVAGLDDLIERMRSLGWKRIFVKLACGSSASGVVAIQTGTRGMRAVTSMEMLHGGGTTKIYNSLKIRTYTCLRQIRRIVDFLCREGAHVEQWLPRASLNGRVMDFRIVVVDSIAKQVVVRTSRSPMTNLHLGNKRGNWMEVERKIGREHRDALIQESQRAASVLAGCRYVGIDAMLAPSFKSPTIIEMNAYGDLLPGVLHDGLSTHESEILAIAINTPRKK